MNPYLARSYREVAITVYRTKFSTGNFKKIQVKEAVLLKSFKKKDIAVVYKMKKFFYKKKFIMLFGKSRTGT